MIDRSRSILENVTIMNTPKIPPGTAENRLWNFEATNSNNVPSVRGFAFVYPTIVSCRLLSRQLKLKHSSMKIAVVKSNICTEWQYNWTPIPFISTQESHSTSLVGRSSICNFEAPNSNMNATRRSNQWHDVLISFTVVPCRLLSRQNTLAVVKSNICTE